MRIGRVSWVAAACGLVLVAANTSCWLYARPPSPKEEEFKADMEVVRGLRVVARQDPMRIVKSAYGWGDRLAAIALAESVVKAHDDSKWLGDPPGVDWTGLSRDALSALDAAQPRATLHELTELREGRSRLVEGLAKELGGYASAPFVCTEEQVAAGISKTVGKAEPIGSPRVVTIAPDAGVDFDLQRGGCYDVAFRTSSPARVGLTFRLQAEPSRRFYADGDKCERGGVAYISCPYRSGSGHLGLDLGESPPVQGTVTFQLYRKPITDEELAQMEKDDAASRRYDEERKMERAGACAYCFRETGCDLRVDMACYERFDACLARQHAPSASRWRDCQ